MGFAGSSLRHTSEANLKHLLYSTANECNVAVDDLVGPSHARTFVNLRRSFARLAREQGYTYPQIGRVLNRHHPTILHLVRT